MRGLKTWAWAAVIAAATSSPAFAQTTGGTQTGTGGITSGGAGTTGIGGGTSSLGGSSLGGSSLGGSSLGGSSMGGNSSGSGSSDGLSSLQQQNSQYTNIGISTSNALQKSNVFAGFYANPYAMGLSATSGATGFGQALYGNTSTTSGGRTGTTGGGRGGQSASNLSGIVVPLPVQIHYRAQMQFPTPPVAAPKLQADLRGVIDAGGLTDSKTVQVIADGTNVTLRGTVRDDEEARLVEGLVRLTPGVGNITNELTFPIASK